MNIDEIYEIKYGRNNKFIDYLYKRGFLISEQEYIVNKNWQTKKLLDDLYITYDSDNDIIHISKGGGFILILGIVLDTLTWSMDNKKIADILLDEYFKNYDDFLNHLDYINGKYILVVGKSKNDALLFQDAMGLRSVYFDTKKCLISSHYNLINDISNNERNPFMETYLNMKPVPWILPANTTPYKNIYSLLPNHSLKIDHKNDCRIKRFFPRQDYGDISVDFAYDYIAETIRKEMEILQLNKNIMIEMTRGGDSRITLAASKQITKKQDILFYSYVHEGNSEYVKDAMFSQQLMNRIGVEDGKFILVDFAKSFCTADEYEQIKSIARHNHYHEHLWRAIPAYFKMLPKNYLSIRSWGVEIIRADYYGLMPNKATASDIIKYGDYAKYTDNKYLMDLFDKFFHEFEFNKIYNFLSQHIFYWERRMGLWGSSCMIKNDINFDTFVPFNVRKFFEYGLSIPVFYKKSNTVVYELVNRLSPELWFDIPNTDYRLNVYNKKIKGLGQLVIMV